MVKFSKRTVVLLNVFLALSVLVNVVMIVSFYESQQDFEALVSERRKLSEVSGLSISKSSFYSSFPGSMCQSGEDCSDLFIPVYERTEFYSDKIIISPEIRRAAVSAASYEPSAVSRFKSLCDELEESVYCRELVSVYYWVRDEIGYVTGPSGGCRISDVCQDAESVLKSEAGKCDEQAVLLVSLLRSLGVDSWIVLLNTEKSFSQCLKTNCTINSADHAMVVARLNEFSELGDELDYWYLQNDLNSILLDPTCTGCEFGELPSKAEDGMVWVT